MKTPLGELPVESGFIKNYRIHQSWWRKFVLNEEEGRYWDTRNKKETSVGNRINNGDKTLKNFLSKAIADVASDSINENESGIIEADRLFNNLLSSQPLAFNFIGFLKINPVLALAFCKAIHPDVTEVEKVIFEYAPKSCDHSAFDFGFKVNSKNGKGFIGFECKYTDTFSYKRKGSNLFYGDQQGNESDKNHISYNKLFNSHRERFPDEYCTYIKDKNFNQLFRNELLAVQLQSEYSFIKTGLFCHHDDKSTVDAGLKFQSKIGNRKDDFVVITYRIYFEILQSLDLRWEQREYLMLLWARYCGVSLSAGFNKMTDNMLNEF